MAEHEEVASISRHHHSHQDRRRDRQEEEQEQEEEEEEARRRSSKRQRDHHHHRHRRHHHDDDDDDNDDDGGGEERGEPPVHPRLALAGLHPLTKEDYYSHSAPFRHWLLTSRKPRRLNDLTSSESHSLFRKFIDKFNRGTLSDLYYTEGGITSHSLAAAAAATAVGQTSYKWGFVEKRSSKEKEEVDLLRDGVDSLTNGTSRGARERRDKERKSTSYRPPLAGEEEDGEEIGPRMPPPRPATSASATSAPTTASLGREAHPTDARLAAEEAADSARRQSQAKRRVQRRDAQVLHEEVNPRATGRAATVEKRRETNRANREFEAARGAGEVEVPEEQLMGDDGSFQQALAAQQRSRLPDPTAHQHSHPRSKAQEAREAKRLEKQMEIETKRRALQAKEAGTMAMLKELAKSRFGSS